MLSFIYVSLKTKPVNVTKRNKLTDEDDEEMQKI